MGFEYEEISDHNWYRTLNNPNKEKASWYSKIRGSMQWDDVVEAVRHRRLDVYGRAEQRAQVLGHRLGPWNAMDSNRCLKCGDLVYTAITSQTHNPDDFWGRAVSAKCRVHFQDEHRHKFEFLKPEKKLFEK